jgi:hypothetical protein
MPKRKPPTRLPNPRTAQSPDAAALAKRLMSPSGLLNLCLQWRAQCQCRAQANGEGGADEGG